MKLNPSEVQQLSREAVMDALKSHFSLGPDQRFWEKNIPLIVASRLSRQFPAISPGQWNGNFSVRSNPTAGSKGKGRKSDKHNHADLVLLDRHLKQPVLIFEFKCLASNKKSGFLKSGEPKRSLLNAFLKDVRVCLEFKKKYPTSNVFAVFVNHALPTKSAFDSDQAIVYLRKRALEFGYTRREFDSQLLPLIYFWD